MKTYQKIAGLIDIINNAETTEHVRKAKETLWKIERNILPSGSGFDAGCTVLLDECKKDKIVIQCNFHHINGGGYYDGWTEHKLIITPCLRFGYDVRVTGRNKRDIKEYIIDVMYDVLNSINNIQ